MADKSKNVFQCFYTRSKEICTVIGNQRKYKLMQCLPTFFPWKNPENISFFHIPRNAYIFNVLQVNI